MPERMRIIICGYDPMLVRGYIKTKSEEALWFYLPKKFYEDYELTSGDIIKGTVEKIFSGSSGEVVATPNENFEWSTSKFTGMAVVLDTEFIKKHKLTAWHFIEITIESIIKKGEEIEVYPGEVLTRKMWPVEKLQLHYSLNYVE